MFLCFEKILRERERLFTFSLASFSLVKSLSLTLGSSLHPTEKLACFFTPFQFIFCYSFEKEEPRRLHRRSLFSPLSPPSLSPFSLYYRSLLQSTTASGGLSLL